MSNFDFSDSPYDYSTPQTRELEAQHQQQAESILNDALETWRQRAIAQYPAVAPLAEYLTAESADKVMELARDLSGKLQGSAPGSGAVSVPGGSPAIDTGHPGDSVLREAQMVEHGRGGGPILVPSETTETQALKRRARQGDFSAQVELMSLRRREAGGY